MKSMRDTFISTLKLHGLFKEESTEDLIRYLKM